MHKKTKTASMMKHIPENNVLEGTEDISLYFYENYFVKKKLKKKRGGAYNLRRINIAKIFAVWMGKSH